MISSRYYGAEIIFGKSSAPAATSACLQLPPERFPFAKALSACVRELFARMQYLDPELRGRVSTVRVHARKTVAASFCSVLLCFQ